LLVKDNLVSGTRVSYVHVTREARDIRVFSKGVEVNLGQGLGEGKDTTSHKELAIRGESHVVGLSALVWDLSKAQELAIVVVPVNGDGGDKVVEGGVDLILCNSSPNIKELPWAPASAILRCSLCRRAWRRICGRVGRRVGGRVGGRVGRLAT
jgi:hypothetical protein